MEGMIFIQNSPSEVDFYYHNEKLLSVINASVIFTPASIHILKDWKPEKYKQLAEYTAPFIAKMLK